MLSPTKTMHHTDAKGSKSFAENLHFAFVIGNLNMDQLGQIACTKFRRAKRLPPSIIRVEGEFNDVVAPTNYHIDAKGQIIDKDTISSTGGQVSPSVNDFGEYGDVSEEQPESNENNADTTGNEGEDE
jgi:hypothetical protein